MGLHPFIGGRLPVFKTVVDGNSANTFVTSQVVDTTLLGATTGDVLIAFAFLWANAVDTPSGLSSSGWTLQSSSTSNQGCAFVLSKVAGGSEPSSYTFSWTGVAVSIVGIARYSSATDVDGSGSASNGNGASITVPSLTPSGSSDVWVTWFGLKQWGLTSVTNGLTSRFSDTSVDPLWLFLYDKQLSSSSATGTSTASSISGGNVWAMGTILVKP